MATVRHYTSAPSGRRTRHHSAPHTVREVSCSSTHTADRWVSASTLRTVPFRFPLPWVIGVSCVSPEPSDLPHQQFYLVLPALLFSTSQDHSTQVSSFVSLCLAGLQDQTLRALHTSVAAGLTTMRHLTNSTKHNTTKIYILFKNMVSTANKQRNISIYWLMNVG